MHTGCALCKDVLDPDRWLQFEPPCGHKYHYVCVRHLLTGRPGFQGGSAPFANAKKAHLACAVCTELAFNEDDGLQLAHRECSREILRPVPSDAEFWLGTELVLGRPVKRLSAVPRSILYLRGLRCLDFTAHPISRVPPEISRISSLRRLVFVSVPLKELPEEIGSLQLLEQLFATGCQLRGLPGTISGMRNLWEFYVDGNQLQSLPEALPERVDSLKVSGNELTHLPELHSNVKNIRAYGNRLAALPASICHCNRLCDLLLQGNELRALPEEIGSVPSIRTLMLHDNHLESLPESLVNLQDLRWVYLYNNHLRELPRGLLSRMAFLERLLVESNPLTGSTMVDLFGDIPRSLRAFGVDASQVDRYHTEVAGEVPALPSCVVSGWMLPWGRLYGKLTPASQLRRVAGVELLRGEGPTYGGDVLVVAFAASQGEPEWFGVLGQLLGDKVRARISRGRVQDFEELHREVWGSPPGEDGEEAAQRAMAAMWLEPADGREGEATKKARLECPAEDGRGRRLADFDVLSLCETNAQWYADTPYRALGVEARLADIRRRYRRVLLLGTSMGGFAALSHAHLAHAVAVFGPQTDLRISHLRPGFSFEDLTATTARMMSNVERAVSAGTRIEYHVAMEDHLLYARRLPLPPGGLVVHPIYGRIARVLERAGVLAPIIADLVADLQRRAKDEAESGAAGPGAAGGGAEGLPEPRPAAAAAAVAGTEERLAWDWASDERQVLLGRWDHGPESALFFVRASGRQLLLLSRSPPKFGDWFCTHCWSRNDEQAASCQTCGTGCGGAPTVGPPWAARAWRGREQRSAAAGPRLCPRCGKEQPPDSDACEHCHAQLLRHCPNCRSEQKEGRRDSVVDVWYCAGCWEKFAAFNAKLREDIPAQWFVEGGQRWAWSDGSRGRGESCGYIDFCRNGRLDTSWGKGAWRSEGRDMDVTFGWPPRRRRLRRTASGFVGVPLASQGDAFASGWPLYGVPASLGWFPLLMEHLAVLVSKLLQLLPGRRDWRRLIPALLALASALSLGIRARHRLQLRAP